MQSKNQIKPLRPAASLILSLSQQKPYNFLTLIRKPHMSFANSIVFPGGVCEQIDKKYLPNSTFQQFSKITAIRQTLQQTGILILPPKEVLKNELKYRKLYSQNKLEEIIQYLVTVWSLNLKYIYPIARFVTPHMHKMSRYDCIFFIASKQANMINLGSNSGLAQLKIHTKESSNYFWLSPRQYLTMNGQGKLELPPPQIILFNALLSLQTKKIPIWELQNNLKVSIEPIFFQFKFNEQRQLLILGDSEYNWKDYYNNEPDSQNGKLIKQLLKNAEGRKEVNQVRRIRWKKQDNIIRAILISKQTQPEQTILKFIANQQKATL